MKRLVNSLGNYLTKRKGVSAYISDVYAYISDLEKRLVKRLEHRLYKRKCRLYTWKGASA